MQLIIFAVAILEENKTAWKCVNLLEFQWIVSMWNFGTNWMETLSEITKWKLISEIKKLKLISEMIKWKLIFEIKKFNLISDIIKWKLISEISKFKLISEIFKSIY